MSKPLSPCAAGRCRRAEFSVWRDGLGQGERNVVCRLGACSPDFAIILIAVYALFYWARVINAQYVCARMLKQGTLKKCLHNKGLPVQLKA